MTNRKICLKCLEVTRFGGEHCTRCAEKLVSFTPTCECGAGLGDTKFPARVRVECIHDYLNFGGKRCQ